MGINRTKWVGVSMIALTAGYASALRAQTLPASSSTPAATAAAPSDTALQEIVVTSEKRAENVQNVAASIQVLDNQKLKDLQVSELKDYIKFIPSLATQTQGPDQTSIYLRGVSSGDNANHSGPLPTVGVYLDDMPITTIGGTLEVPMYDVSRIEVLPGPQGTLYGASSEAGTVRIISNQPSTDGFEAGYSLEGDTVDHGGEGFNAEGFINVPLSDMMAVRLVAWDQHDAGYIDNVPARRTFATSGYTINNAPFAKNDFNPNDMYGARAALKINLDDNWTLTPSIIAQEQRNTGIYGYLPAVGNLETERFGPDSQRDQWMQAALNITGHIGDYELTNAGGFFVRDLEERQDYTDYSVFYDAIYGSGSIWKDNQGKILQAPQQTNVNHYHYNKESDELRLASPQSDRFRFIVGAYEEIQNHAIIQDQSFQNVGYHNAGIPNQIFSPSLQIPGWFETLWLTDQLRTDRDYAAFTEVSYDITNQLTVTGGVRPYYYDNSLYGFFGYSQGFDQASGFSAGEGANLQNCIPGKSYNGAPCVNLNKSSTGSGETHKINITFKFDDEKLAYFTYSTGYRPGGVNRNGNFGPYNADYLTNFELGLKTSWLDNSLVWNSAVYDEDWNDFQFSFLGPNLLTVIENAPAANVTGAESSLDWRATQHLTLSSGITLTDAQLTANFCGTDENTGGLIKNCSKAASVAPAGTHLPYTPDLKGFATARYSFPVMSWAGHLQGAVSFQSKNNAALRQADNAALGSMPSYATFDLSAGVEGPQSSIEFFVKNLFDSNGEVNRYTTCAISTCLVKVAGVPAPIYVVPTQPLTIGLRFSQKF
jgi:outer membrane receptor protein involved in Fe transport